MNILEIENPLKSYLDKVASIPRMSYKEQDFLLKKAYQGSKEAKEKVIEANLYRVVELARSFTDTNNSLFFDLVQEGNMALIESVNRYGKSGNSGFFTMNSKRHIIERMTDVVVNYDRPINIPKHRAGYIKEIDDNFYELSKELGRNPSMEELADSIGVSLKVLLARIKRINTCREFLSLDEPINPDDDECFGDLIPDKYSLEEIVIRDTISSFVFEVIKTLTDREIAVITLRYGLNKRGPMTLEEVALSMDVTRERVRQIEQKALRKLKHPSKKLYEFLD